ncbi:hypothetical protein, partial [Bacteroides thetaiotaomicron]
VYLYPHIRNFVVERDLNKIKVMLAEDKHIKRLKQQLDKDSITVLKWYTNILGLDTFIEIAQLLDVDAQKLIRTLRVSK